MANLESLIIGGYGLKPQPGQSWDEFTQKQMEIEFDGANDVILIEQEDEPVASLSLVVSGETAYIQGIVVKPELQQQGLGMQLLETMQEKHQPQIIYGETNSLSLVKTLFRFSQKHGWAMIWGEVGAGEYSPATQERLNQLVAADGGIIQPVEAAILPPLPLDNLLKFPGNFKLTAGQIVKQQFKTQQPHIAPFVLIPLTAEDKQQQPLKVTIADVLPYKKLGGQLMHERIRAVKELQLIEKQLEFELRTLDTLLPPELVLEATNLWFTIRKFSNIPEVGDAYSEIKHPFGPVKAFAVGLLKSLKYGQPMLELHGTACPSYVPFEQWRRQGLTGSEIATKKIIPGTVESLQKVTEWLKPYSGKYFQVLLIHTPSPFDRDCDFADHMEAHVLIPQNGHDQLAAHWLKMLELAEQVPGMDLAVDLPFIAKHFSQSQAEKLLQKDQQLKAAFHQFINSQYVADAYLQWGQVNKLSIFCGLYLGTIMAYGNHESAFNLKNNLPVKLYMNFEEHHGPETFAGLMTGVDERHILAKYGYHLPLLVADHRLRTPWLED